MYFVIMIKDVLDCVFLGQRSSLEAVSFESFKQRSPPGVEVVRASDVSNTAASGGGPRQEGGADPGQAVEGLQGADPA